MLIYSENKYTIDEVSTNGNIPKRILHHYTFTYTVWKKMYNIKIKNNDKYK